MPHGLQFHSDIPFSTEDTQTTKNWEAFKIETSKKILNFSLHTASQILDKHILNFKKLFHESNIDPEQKKLLMQFAESKGEETYVSKLRKYGQPDKQLTFQQPNFQYFFANLFECEETGVPRQTKNITSKNVVNLSSKQLSKTQISVLSKGLNFCPSKTSTSKFEIISAVDNLIRNLKLKYFFAINPSSNTQSQPCFKKPSTWTPSIQIEALKLYEKAIIQDLCSHSNKKLNKPNLTIAEKNAITELQTDQDIIIKRADKGGAIVVMNRLDYIEEANRQLTDSTFYTKIQLEQVATMNKNIEQCLKNLYKTKKITKDMFEYMRCPTPSAGRFYLLPKIHKPNNPGRPIVSSNGTVTEAISSLVDTYLKELPAKLPSHVRDSTHFMQILSDFVKHNTIPTPCLLVTLDVGSLYTNIPHNEGIEASQQALLSANHAITMVETVCDLIDLVLKNNYFEFNKELYLQIHGTAMGTKMAPSYANLFMGKLENDMLNGYPKEPKLWLRYFDDAFMIWTHGEHELNQFILYLNSYHPTIKFTTTSSTKTVSFLDVLVTIQNGTLQTTLYRKPTDTRQYLHYNSNHPKSCRNAIPLGQALRIRRICSEQTDYISCLNEMCQDFSNRGYPRSLLNETYKKTEDLPRTLEIKPKPTSELPPSLIVKYNDATQNFKNILRKHHNILQTNPLLKSLFPDCINVVYKKEKSIGDILVRAKINSDDNKGCFPCNNKPCTICQYVITTNEVRSNNGTFRHKIQQRLDCNSSNAIYLIRCQKCNIDYVGETGRSVRVRIKEHIYAIKSKKDLPVANHFTMSGHDPSYFRIYLLEANFKTARERQQKESLFILKFGCLTPNGINIDKGALPQIFDNL